MDCSSWLFPLDLCLYPWIYITYGIILNKHNLYKLSWSFVSLLKPALSCSPGTYNHEHYFKSLLALQVCHCLSSVHVDSLLWPWSILLELDHFVYQVVWSKSSAKWLTCQMSIVWTLKPSILKVNPDQQVPNRHDDEKLGGTVLEVLAPVSPCLLLVQITFLIFIYPYM